MVAVGTSPQQISTLLLAASEPQVPIAKCPVAMTSSVFFRFKSQKEPTRVAFDGTGISVFELKREIILSNRLGDGSDFELVISSEDTGEGNCHWFMAAQQR